MSRAGRKSGIGDGRTRLLRDFPEWNFVRSDKGRWWAFRLPPRDDPNRVSDVDADTADELHARLCEITGRVDAD
ncbi:MAG TPA: hypothetical protein VIL71_14195 [Spirillospora sp.]